MWQLLQSLLEQLLKTLLGIYVIGLLMPISFFLLAYAMILYFKLYRYFGKNGDQPFTDDSWKPARLLVAHFWNTLGKFYYGYEVEGLEHIPATGPALIIFYHGTVNLDWYCFTSRVFIRSHRLLYAAGDKFINKLPGKDGLLEGAGLCTGNMNSLVEILKRGDMLSIAPGGVKEALFGDSSYSLLWGTRTGFAKVALQAKVPIIPVFTRNIREAFFTLSIGKRLFRWIYEKTRLPIVPMFGGFPVKLTTFVGKPIPYDPNTSPEMLAKKVASRMQDLIEEHQLLPGSITRAVRERFRHFFVSNKID